ncbi:putative glucuronosyltransferase [Iris pallida]|uniref:Glucuronosyltransferase n=1 Tax=Iris pallida TaxID=29817 RepID=A0AAX6H8K4_IRIPA|nr:putative glucuronosyltransferase [Iris pallida]
MAMAELKKMKVLPRRAPALHHLKKLLFFKKYYRWVLWLSLSLYFFYSSFLFSTPTAPAAPAAGAHRPPELGIYVYDLPPNYNRDRLAADGRCRSYLFAAEVAIHEALAGSPLAVSDPAEADFFLVPVYVSCNFSTANGFPSLSYARPLLRSAVHRVSALHPFWNRSSDRDHVFVASHDASHDYGACFHACHGGRGGGGRDTGVHEVLAAAADVRGAVAAPVPGGGARGHTAVRVARRDGVGATSGGGQEGHMGVLPGEDGGAPQERQRQILQQEGEDGDMEPVQREPVVPPEEKAVRQVPVRDCTVGLLPVSARLGSLEPAPGRVGGARVRARGDCEWHPAPVSRRGRLAFNLADGARA